MKRVIACLIAGLVLGAVGTASAATTNQARIDGVRIVDPYWVEMTVSYRCTGYMDVIGGVTQPSDRAGGDLAWIEVPFQVPCTGRWEQTVLHLHYPTFQEHGIEPGFAEASISIEFGVNITKKVRIS